MSNNTLEQKVIYWCKGGIYDPFNGCHHKHLNECRGKDDEVEDCSYRYEPLPEVAKKYYSLDGSMIYKEKFNKEDSHE